MNNVHPDTKKRRFRVALAVPQGPPFLERMLHGVSEFARENASWLFTRIPEGFGTSLEWLQHWQVDGALALITNWKDAKIAQSLPFAVVNLASHIVDLPVPTVAVDNHEIGVIAAKHLIARRFKRFGYYGVPTMLYSRLRYEGFREMIVAQGGTCEVLHANASPENGGLYDQHKQLETWLLSIKPPFAVMASTDVRAGMVLQACATVGLRVPKDVAVIGVDNDPVFAEFDDPPLTTVARNDREVGRQAAALLHRLIAGELPPKQPILIKPEGVISRQSTQVDAIEDEAVAAAVNYIKEHVGERFGVESLLAVASISRRSLETRFRAALGASPYDYINTVRIERAKQLLLDPKRIKLTTVADACGFCDARRLNLVFRRVTGLTPSAYRHRHFGQRVVSSEF